MSDFTSGVLGRVSLVIMGKSVDTEGYEGLEFSLVLFVILRLCR